MPTHWRMPTDEPFESVVERRIREASERGEFENLPGAGEPLPELGEPYDPRWWAKRYVEREKARDRADELRRAIRAELPHLRVAADRDEARARVDQLNEIVAAVNQHLKEADRITPIEL